MGDHYPDDVLAQQEAIRRSGAINMFGRSGVKRLAEGQFGFDELAEWIDEHGQGEYIAMAEAAAEGGR
mgnify:CR=1 FL=1